MTNTDSFALFSTRTITYGRTRPCTIRTDTRGRKFWRMIPKMICKMYAVRGYLKIELESPNQSH